MANQINPWEISKLLEVSVLSICNGIKVWDGTPENFKSWDESIMQLCRTLKVSVFFDPDPRKRKPLPRAADVQPLPQGAYDDGLIFFDSTSQDNDESDDDDEDKEKEENT